MPGHTFRERELVQNLKQAFDLLDDDQILGMYRNFPIATQMVVRRIIKQAKKYESTNLSFNHGVRLAEITKRNAIQANLQDFLTSVAVFTI